jgi:hypothetical protein
VVLHLIPDDGAPHAPTSECGCGPDRSTTPRPDGTHGTTYTHRDMTADDGPEDSTHATA